MLRIYSNLAGMITTVTHAEVVRLPGRNITVCYNMRFRENTRTHPLLQRSSSAKSRFTRDRSLALREAPYSPVKLVFTPSKSLP